MKSYIKSKTSFPLKNLLRWYSQNKRDLPWRKTKEPYKIWISEIMLQQTTSAAVVNYYHNFLKVFPNLKTLALAKEAEVLQAWAGLGYYSRARNLHKSAIELNKKKFFPQDYKDLLTLPGFGNYTARSVSSFAFNQTLGVLDTNVIRFLCRYNNLNWEWWKSKPRAQLQNIVDDYASQAYKAEVLNKKNSTLINCSQLNQALIEIGANICTPKNPQCIICPLSTSCKAFKNQSYLNLPLKKTKLPQEIYSLKMQILTNYKKEFALDLRAKKPFLKNIPLPPSNIIKLKKEPKEYDFIHYITRYKIFVSVNKKNSTSKKDYLWVKSQNSSLHSPTSLLKKALKTVKAY